jgi:hypothetical protein
LGCLDVLWIHQVALWVPFSGKFFSTSHMVLSPPVYLALTLLHPW